MATGIETEALLTSPGTHILTTAVVELSVPSLLSFMEHTQPSPLPTITQGSHRSKQLLLFFLSPFCIIIKFKLCLKSFSVVSYRPCISY